MTNYVRITLVAELNSAVTSTEAAKDVRDAVTRYLRLQRRQSLFPLRYQYREGKDMRTALATKTAKGDQTL